MRGLGEYALVRRSRRMQEFPDHSFGHIELGIDGTQAHQLFHSLHSLFAAEDLRISSADLGREHAHPYFFGLRPGVPKLDEVLKVARPLHHLAGNRAMDGHITVTNAFQYPGVSCGFTARIVLRLQAINGDHNVKPLKPGPFLRYGTKSTGDDLDVNASGIELREQLRDLAVADQRVAADDREVQRTVFIHQGEQALHQFLASLVMKLPQVHTAYMSFFVGVTSGTAQRTLPRDFNGERRPSAAQDAFPGLNDFAGPHISFRLVVNASSTPCRF